MTTNLSTIPAGVRDALTSLFEAIVDVAAQGNAPSAEVITDEVMRIIREPGPETRPKARPFDFFEVHKVAEYADPKGGTFAETIDTPQGQEWADEEAVSQYFTVYGWRRWPDVDPLPLDDGYGATAISDHVEEQDALDMVEALSAGLVPVEVMS